MYLQAHRLIVYYMVVNLVAVHPGQAQSGYDASVAEASVLTDGERPTDILVEFTVRSSTPIAGVSLFYRSTKDPSFHRTTLSHNRALNYEGRLKYADTVMYFLEIQPESGGAVQIGSAMQPLSLEAAALPRIKEPRSETSGRWILLAASVIAAILGIAFVTTRRGESE